MTFDFERAWVRFPSGTQMFFYPTLVTNEDFIFVHVWAVIVNNMSDVYFCRIFESLLFFLQILGGTSLNNFQKTEKLKM